MTLRSVQTRDTECGGGGGSGGVVALTVVTDCNGVVFNMGLLSQHIIIDLSNAKER
jgi:hypothetical protein